MGVSWRELQATPLSVVHDYLIVMKAESAAKQRGQQEQERGWR